MRLPILVCIFFGLVCIQLKLSAQDVVMDFDGNEYPTVLIGEQIWMAKNLNSIHDANGKKIKRICYQLINENCDTHGGLYAWDDLKISEDDNKQGICPDGWHIPDDEEWSELIESLGGADSASYLISRDTALFNIQYGGNYHHRLRNYNYLDEIAYYWTANAYSTTAAWMRMFGRKNVNSNRSTVPKVYCLSVRCLKD